MKKLRQNISKFSGIFFFVMFLMIFFERIDFLGELLDKDNGKNALKKAIKNEEAFKKSEIKNNKDTYSKFNRFDLSNFISVPEYKEEMLKFDTVKQYQEKENEAMKTANIIFIFVSFICLSSRLKRFFCSLICSVWRFSHADSI